MLDQIGVSWEPISSRDELSPENYSVIIVNVVPTSLQSRDLHDFLRSGGAILGVHGCAQELSGSAQRKQYFTSLSPFQFGELRQNEMMDIFFEGIRETKLLGGKEHLIGIHHIGKGVLICIPFDVNAMILDFRSKRKNFYFEKKRLPSEIVATASKGVLRRFLVLVLEYLHRNRDIPFVHKWYFPEGWQTIFTFRVDSDSGTQKDINELYALCVKNSVPTMWFLDTKSHQGWLPRFKDFVGQEIGVHCYEHSTFTSYARNEENLIHAVTLLEKSGIRPAGASAPYGTWNSAIAGVFEHLGMSFSSEFSLDYDDLPFFPVLHHRSTPVLQLPIHPICVGSMSRAGYSTEEMKNYFHHIIDKKILEREPICLYHHPTHHKWEVIEDMFRYLRSKHIQSLSYSQYAGWWRKRSTCKAQPEYDAQTHTMRATAGDDSPTVHWRIVFPSGEEAIAPIQNVMQLDSLTRRNRPAQMLPPADIMRIRRFDFRHFIMNSLDAWYKRTQ